MQIQNTINIAAAFTQGQQHPLYQAIDQGNLSTLKAILETGINVNQPLFLGLTALCLAITKGELEIVQELLKHHADPNQKQADSKRTPLQFALDHNADLTIFVALLEYGAKLEQIAILKGMSPEEELSFLSILAALSSLDLPLFDLIKFAKKVHDTKITVQEITNIVDKAFPEAFRENFDEAFKHAYQSALKIRVIDRYARKNGFLNLQAAPSESSLSSTKELGVKLPEELSEYITSFTLQLPLPATGMLFEVLKENEDKSYFFNRKAIQTIFLRKADTYIKNQITELIDAKTAETQKLASEAQAKTDAKKAQEERISTKAEMLISRTIEEAKKREQEQAKEEREGKDTLEKFKTKPIEKKDLTSSTSKEDRSR